MLIYALGPLALQVLPTTPPYSHPVLTCPEWTPSPYPYPLPPLPCPQLKRSNSAQRTINRSYRAPIAGVYVYRRMRPTLDTRCPRTTLDVAPLPPTHRPSLAYLRSTILAGRVSCIPRQSWRQQHRPVDSLKWIRDLPLPLTMSMVVMGMLISIPRPRHRGLLLAVTL